MTERIYRWMLRGLLVVLGIVAVVLASGPFLGNRAEGQAGTLVPGDIVVADGSAGLLRVPAGGGTAEVIVSGPPFSSLEDVAIDGAGNLIAADIGNNTIFRVSCDGTSVETVATLSGVNTRSVHDVAVDASGDYIVLVHFDTSLFRVTPGGVVSLIATISGANETEGLDIDASGNFIIADEFPSSDPPPGLLYRVSPDGSSIEVLGDDSATSDGPEAVIVDTDGTYVVIDETDPALYRVSTDGLTISLIYAGAPAPFSSDGPQGIALAPGGDYLVADEGDRAVQVARNGSSATIISSGAPLSRPRDLTVYPFTCGEVPAPTPTPTPTGAAPPEEGLPFGVRSFPPKTPIPTPTSPPPPAPTATPVTGVVPEILPPETGSGGHLAEGGSLAPPRVAMLGAALGALALGSVFVGLRLRAVGSRRQR